MNAVGGIQREVDAGAFEDEDHAEETGRVAAVDQVVGVGDHQFGRQVGATVAHCVGIATGSGDVVEDPFLVADFLRDVLGDASAHPRQALGQAAAQGHQ